MTLCLSISFVAPAVPQETTDHAAGRIEELLGERARALLDRDRAAFLRTIYPGSEDFLRRQTLLFERLSDLPLAGLSLSVDLEAYGDLARPSDEKRYPKADEITIPLTEERYRLDGYDRAAVIQDAYFTFVREGDRWFIGNDSDLDDLALYSQKNPWDLSEVALTAGRRILVVSSGCGGAPCPGAGPLVATAEAAIERVDSFWDRPWNKRVPVFAPDDPGDLAEIIQATFPIDNYVAFAFWTGGAGKSEGARIIADPSDFAASSAERVFSVLAHEFTHVATLPYRGSFMPRFLDEGFAQIVQYGGPSSILDSAVGAAGSVGLPEDYEFFIGDAAGVQLVYRESFSAASFIAEEWGPDALTRLYRRVGRAGVGPGTADHHVNEAFRRVLGSDIAAFEEAWASSIVGP